MRVDMEWDERSGELTTRAWICPHDRDSPGEGAVMAGLGRAYDPVLDVHYDTELCRAVEATRIISRTPPRNLADYMHGIRFGWTMGSIDPGEVVVEDFSVRLVW